MVNVHPAILVGCCQEPAMLTVVPMTTNPNARYFPMTIPIEKSQSNHLSEDSFALVYQVTAIDPKRLRSPKGRLDESDYEDVKVKLREHLKL